MREWVRYRGASVQMLDCNKAYRAIFCGLFYKGWQKNLAFGVIRRHERGDV